LLTSPLNPEHPFFAIECKAQRDMVWSVLGPSMLDCSWAPQHPSWLQADWQLLSHAEAEFTPEFSSTRLGLMFEQLWQRALSLTGSDWLANLQISGPERTLGELDLLLRQADKEWHLELALKFYLGHRNEWIGPNRRDRLTDKLAHTHSHQLALSQQPEGKKALELAGWHAPEPQALMRGCLFHPAKPEFNGSLPEEVSASHWRGRWCHYRDAAELLPDGPWYVISKPDWISPVRCPLTVERAELIRYLTAHFEHLTVAVCAVVATQGRYGWVEQQRWLIMPDNWPQGLD